VAGSLRQDEAAAALRAAIEQEGPALRRGVELLILKMGLGSTRQEIANLADDITQETVLRALGKSATYDPARSAHAWLLGFAANVIREQMRRRQHERQRFVQPLAPTAANADEEVEARLTESLLDPRADGTYRLIELLDLVGPADRQVLTLAYVDRLSGPALADALGVKEGAARVRLSRALARLAAAYRRAEQPPSEESR
jgi:RNA polymerase sigma-70 factor (ECF subfamily)